MKFRYSWDEDKMNINFIMFDRFNPIINIKGYLNVYDDSDYCMAFYDSFDDICARIPLNPFAWYSDDYYDYIDLVYHFECDVEFLPIVKEFAESADKDIIIQRPHYDLVLEKKRS